jgi:hypothetical protein
VDDCTTEDSLHIQVDRRNSNVDSRFIPNKHVTEPNDIGAYIPQLRPVLKVRHGFMGMPRTVVNHVLELPTGIATAQ